MLGSCVLVASPAACQCKNSSEVKFCGEGSATTLPLGLFVQVSVGAKRLQKQGIHSFTSVWQVFADCLEHRQLGL